MKKQAVARKSPHFHPPSTDLSPAWADSTDSARRMTSRLWGMQPRGSSACTSWIRTFWKSTKRDLCVSSRNWVRLLHQIQNLATVLYSNYTFFVRHLDSVGDPGGVSRIPDANPHQGIEVFSTLRILFLSSRKTELGCSSRILDPDFFPSRIQG